MRDVRFIFLLFASVSFLLTSKVLAQQAVCGDYSSATPLSTGDFVETVETGFLYPDQDYYTIPSRIHWHIYASTEYDEPRYSTSPSRYLTPQVSSQGRLRFQVTDYLEEQGSNVGNRVDAGINIYVPLMDLKFINFNNVIEHSLELIVSEDSSNTTMYEGTLKIDLDGVDNRLYVDASTVEVNVDVAGIENLAIIEIGEGSAVSVTGIENSIQVKSSRLSTIDVDGIETSIVLDGAYDRASISSIDGSIRVNSENGCSDVEVDAINSNCESASDYVFEREGLDCTADTKLVEACNGGDICWEYGPFASFLFLLLMLLCCGGCIGLVLYVGGCYRPKCGRGTYSPHQHTADLEMPQMASGQDNYNSYQPAQGVAVAQAVAYAEAEIYPTAAAVKPSEKEVPPMAEAKYY